MGPDAQGRVPALQGTAWLPPALPEWLRLPGSLDRSRCGARAWPEFEKGNRGVRPGEVRAEMPGRRGVVIRGTHQGLGPARPVDGLGPRLLHVLRHEHRVHLAV